MAFPALEIVEIKVLYTVNSQTCMNVLHYQVDGNTTTFSPQDLTEGILDDFLAVTGTSVLDGMLALMSNTVTVFDVTGQGVWPTRFAVRHRAVSLAGANANPVNAQNLAATIEKIGLLGNRHNVGSFHLGGLPPGHFSGGDVTAGSFTLLDNLADAILLPLSDGLSTAQYLPVILNKEPIPDSDPIRYRINGGSEIAETAAKNTARVMRRRTKGVGI